MRALSLVLLGAVAGLGEHRILSAATDADPSSNTALNDLLTDGMDPYFLNALRGYSVDKGESDAVLAESTAEPTAEPTSEPTTKATTKPTAESSSRPTSRPTAEPTEPEDDYDDDGVVKTIEFIASHSKKSSEKHNTDFFHPDHRVKAAAGDVALDESTAKPTTKPTMKPTAEGSVEEPSVEEPTTQAAKEDGNGDGFTADCQEMLTSHCRKFSKYSIPGSTPESCLQCVDKHIPSLSSSCVSAIVVGTTDFTKNFCPAAPAEAAVESEFDHDYGVMFILAASAVMIMLFGFICCPARSGGLLVRTSKRFCTKCVESIEDPTNEDGHSQPSTNTPLPTLHHSPHGARAQHRLPVGSPVLATATAVSYPSHQQTRTVVQWPPTQTVTNNTRYIANTGAPSSQWLTRPNAMDMVNSL